MSPTTPRFPDDPMDYDLPPHSDVASAGGCGFLATGPAATYVRVGRY
jgi:hypothetical protein